MCKCEICNKPIEDESDEFYSCAPYALDCVSDDEIDGLFCGDCQERYMTFENGEPELLYPLIRCREMALRGK